MALINRMDDPVVPTSPDEINFLDAEIQECPTPPYSLPARAGAGVARPDHRHVQHHPL